MIKTRLIRLLGRSRKYILYQILWQWIALAAQIVIAWCAADLFSQAWQHTLTSRQILTDILVALAGILVRYCCDRLYTWASYHASADVKRIMRDKIYEKMLRLGASYRQSVHSSQVVQMASDSVEQLETYFGKYLSQFFYALLAPLTLFFILYPLNHRAAVVLLVAVPLIPIVIMVVMIVARKLLAKYFEIYYGLGDSFLEKLQGMTTLKIYQADEAAAQDMDEESEKFRRITMKVLTMQLNSTTIMDLVAYGGSAIGIITILQEFTASNASLSTTILFILLASQFFLPMRILGSYFHIGMNGMKASDRIFAFLDLPEAEDGKEEVPSGPVQIRMDHVSFGYEPDRKVLQDINLTFPSGTFTSLVGVSGSGKSTIASILSGRIRNYDGSVTINGIELRNIREQSLLSCLTLVSCGSWIFEGTVRDNLMIANENADEASMRKALEEVNLLGFLEENEGLDTHIESNGSNLSGGQRQRLALARALLHDTPVYLFDEATSNIDLESEEMIMHVIHRLAETHTVILISHRLANVVDSDAICMLENGKITETGTHEELIRKDGSYASLFQQQARLESYGKGLQEVQA